MKYGLFDLSAKLRFGRSAPIKFEPVMVRLCHVNERVWHPNRFDGRHPQNDPRCVLSGNWDKNTDPIDFEHLKFRSLERRIMADEGWEKSQLLKERIHTINRTGSADGIRESSDMLKRYVEIDRIIDYVQANGTLARAREINAAAFRERGSIPIMIGRDGRLILGRGGTHRFFIAHILGTREVPMALVTVHPDRAKRVGEVSGLRRLIG